MLKRFCISVKSPVFIDPEPNEALLEPFGDKLNASPTVNIPSPNIFFDLNWSNKSWHILPPFSTTYM